MTVQGQAGPPRRKEFEPDDPMELRGIELAGGDPDEALDALVHEYLMQGCTPLQIWYLFRSPFFGATHQILKVKGEASVKQRINSLAAQWRQGWINGGRTDG